MISIIRQFIEYERQDHTWFVNLLYYFIIPCGSSFLLANYNTTFFANTSSDVISLLIWINAIILVIFGLTINIQSARSIVCEIEDPEEKTEAKAKRIKLEFLWEKLRVMRDAFNIAIMVQGVFLIPSIILIIFAKEYWKYELTFFASYLTILCIEIVIILLSRFPYFNHYKDKLNN